MTTGTTYTKLYKHVSLEMSVSISKEEFKTRQIAINWRCTHWQILNLQKKRILVNRTKAARNKAIKSAVKTSIKKVEAAVAKKDKEAASAALVNAVSTISKATSKGVYHKNNCARKISRLTKAVNSIG